MKFSFQTHTVGLFLKWRDVSISIKICWDYNQTICHMILYELIFRHFVKCCLVSHNTKTIVITLIAAYYYPPNIG